MSDTTRKHLEAMNRYDLESFKDNRAFSEWASHSSSALTLKLGVTGKGYYKVMEDRDNESHSWSYQMAQSAIDKYSEILKKHG